MGRPKSQWELNYLQRQTQINAYARCSFQPRLKETDKILVYHPDEHRRYLQQHPCRDCRAKNLCDLPCEVYLKWYNARVEAARKRGEAGGKIQDTRYPLTER